MMEFKGWIPIYGAIKAIPAISLNSSDYTINDLGYINRINSDVMDEILNIPNFNLTISLDDVPKSSVEFPVGGDTYPHFWTTVYGIMSVLNDVSQLYSYGIAKQDNEILFGIGNIYKANYSDVEYYVVPYIKYQSENSVISIAPSYMSDSDPHSILTKARNMRAVYILNIGLVWVTTITGNLLGTISYNSCVFRDLASERVPYMYSTYDEAIQKIEYEMSNPYEPGGTSGIGGGGGNFGIGVPNDNVSIDTPSGSNFGYVGGSMFTHYALSGNQVEHFGEWLWTDNLGLSLWKTVMEKIFNETADGLIGLMAFPFNISTLPNISLADGTIKAGNLPTGIPARILGSPYTQVDWGTIQLTEYWGNFLDYAPHTKIELYLPWCTGFVPIDPHQVMPDPITNLPVSLSVKTNIDLQKGTCTHNVFAGNTVVGVYEGQVGYEIPLLASNFSAKLAGATVAAVSTLVTAGAAAGIGASISASNAIGMARTSASNAAWKSALSQHISPMPGEYGPMPMTNEAIAFAQRKLTYFTPKEVPSYSQIASGTPMKLATASSSATAKQPVNVSRNGSFSGSSAGMAIQYPYVIISRPEQNIPTGYGHYYGYPSNVGVINMLQLKGYTEIGAIHLNGIRALPDEIAELDDILKGGFII